MRIAPISANAYSKINFGKNKKPAGSGTTAMNTATKAPSTGFSVSNVYLRKIEEEKANIREDITVISRFLEDNKVQAFLKKAADTASHYELFYDPVRVRHDGIIGKVDKYTDGGKCIKTYGSLEAPGLVLHLNDDNKIYEIESRLHGVTHGQIYYYGVDKDGNLDSSKPAVVMENWAWSKMPVSKYKWSNQNGNVHVECTKYFDPDAAYGSQDSMKMNENSDFYSKF